jgi:hypothetical protein
LNIEDTIQYTINSIRDKGPKGRIHRFDTSLLLVNDEPVSFMPCKCNACPFLPIGRYTRVFAYLIVHPGVNWSDKTQKGVVKLEAIQNIDDGFIYPCCEVMNEPDVHFERVSGFFQAKKCAMPGSQLDIKDCFHSAHFLDSIIKPIRYRA